MPPKPKSSKRVPGRRTVAKRATNVTVRSDLLEAARSYGINLSATLESALSDELGRVRQQKWLADNREAIAAYNEHVEKHGVFSDGLRKF
jgi:antitoxin CcdA